MTTNPDPNSSTNPIPANLTATSFNIVTSFDSVHSLNLPIPIKLNDNNFLTWKKQVMPVINGHDLGRFLDSPPPEPTSHNSTGQIEVNKAYLLWNRQDQLLLAWLQSSLTETMMAHVISTTTTREFWRCLEMFFNSNSRARMNDLRRQIQTATKGDISCSEYLLKLRRLADELSFVGAPLPEDELVSTAINGLGPEYNSVVAVVFTARCYGTFTFSDLRGLLLSQEALFHSQSFSLSSSAFYAGKNTSNRVRQDVGSHSTSHFRSVHNGSGPVSVLGPFPNRLTSADTRSVCQICDKVGHKAKVCYRRYDKDPDWKPFSKSKAYNVHSTPSNDSTTWIIDSGANNHVTNDINNLSSFYAYNGSDKLQIGNGFGLTISNIGSSIFEISNLTIKLNNVLHVPNFSTNLLSLSKLIKDNPSLSINFFSSFCSIKDPLIKTQFQIPSTQGLYYLKMFSSTSSQDLP
jgi:gag-polypeptide of LTR copia-type